MKKFDDSGQFILLACVAIALALVLISTYEYSTLMTGGKSIDRENSNAVYYYKNLRELYINNLKAEGVASGVAENELKALAILHGYSVEFIRSGTNTTIVFVDKNLRIEEVLREIEPSP